VWSIQSILFWTYPEAFVLNSENIVAGIGKPSVSQDCLSWTVEEGFGFLRAVLSPLMTLL